MIKTARQLKALISNRAKGDSGKSQMLIRNYAMERFLERLSLSTYKNNFILKGGMLVSSMVGLDNRSTMDIDTTVRDLPFNTENAERIITEIIDTPVDDNICFSIKSVSEIMDEAVYSGVRLSLDAQLENMRIPLKIDISIGDVITPAEILYPYRMMFEEREVSLQAYTLETVLAEKLETVLSRALTNTRLRDFYDIFILQNRSLPIDAEILSTAIKATCRRRESEHVLPDCYRILDELEGSRVMRKLWMNYAKNNSCAENISWEEVLLAVRRLCGIGIGPEATEVSR